MTTFVCLYLDTENTELQILQITETDFLQNGYHQSDAGDTVQELYHHRLQKSASYTPNSVAGVMGEGASWRTSSLPAAMSTISLSTLASRSSPGSMFRKWETTIESISYVTTKTVEISEYPPAEDDQQFAADYPEMSEYDERSALDIDYLESADKLDHCDSITMENNTTALAFEANIVHLTNSEDTKELSITQAHRMRRLHANRGEYHLSKLYLPSPHPPPPPPPLCSVFPYRSVLDQCLWHNWKF